jgi:hypothetical protein
MALGAAIPVNVISRDLGRRSRASMAGGAVLAHLQRVWNGRRRAVEGSLVK